MGQTEALTPEEIEHQLAHHQGGDFYSLGPFFPSVVVSAGVHHMAELCGAHWLYEAIASHIVCDPTVRDHDPQFWRLTVTRENDGGEDAPMARLYAIHDTNDDGTEPEPYAEQFIAYTDFPLDDIRIWAGRNGTGHTIYLPSEH